MGGWVASFLACLRGCLLAWLLGGCGEVSGWVGGWVGGTVCSMDGGGRGCLEESVPACVCLLAHPPASCFVAACRSSGCPPH